MAGDGVIRGTSDGGTTWHTIVRINDRDVTALSTDESKRWDILAREAQRAYALRSGVVEALLRAMPSEPEGAEVEAVVEETPDEPAFGARHRRTANSPSGRSPRPSYCSVS